MAKAKAKEKAGWEKNAAEVEVDNFYAALRDNPKSFHLSFLNCFSTNRGVIAWAEKEIEAYRQLILLIKKGVPK